MSGGGVGETQNDDNEHDDDDGEHQCDDYDGENSI